MARNEKMTALLFAAVDMDCDGPTTHVYRAYVPADWHPDMVLRKVMEWSREGYFGISDFFPLDHADLSIEQMNNKWHEISDFTGDDNCGLASTHFKGKPMGWER